MSKKSHQPADMWPSAQYGFAQVVTTEAKKLVFCAGQTAWDKECNLVGGDDLGQQMAMCLKNIGSALAEAGATYKDVCRLTIYVVNFDPSMNETISNEINKVFDKDHLPANTLLGIQALAMPEFLVEMEATAVIDS